jgi:predicted O-methyltransferase YrrM
MAATDGFWHRLTAGFGRRPGFFLPHRYAASVVPPHSYPALEPVFAAAQAAQLDFLGSIERDGLDLRRIEADGRPPAPRWNQDWFPRLDGAVAYHLVRQRRPRRIVEIGSGHSTRFLARAAADGGLGVAIDCIDPAPRADLAGLAVTLHRRPLQAVGVEPFAALAPGDVLFVDSSHLLVAGSDVDRILNDLWPRLPAGALVHFHDIFLPDSYPASWAWRGYNEQSALGPLLAGDAVRILWSSRYVTTRLAAALAKTWVAALPLPAGAHESSLWLEKR